MEQNICTEETAIRNVVVSSRNGLHARPAAAIAQTANRFRVQVSVRIRDYQVNGKSIIGLLTLGAVCGDHHTIETKGPEASNALDAITALFNSS